MAFGVADTVGVMDRPVTDSAVGVADWATMSGADPAHPLVGGTAGRPGYGSTATRVVAVGAPGTQPAAATAARSNWAELFNFRGNPLGWVLVAALAYLALTHIHVRAGASAKVKT